MEWYSGMTEHFDPYHKWLGIPPKDQPANHYRLLGVEKYETDREVIDAAANRLMAYLQDLSTGESAAPAQRLLNQISAARLVLLNPSRKDEYDKQLQAESVPVARPVAPRTAPPLARPAPIAPTPPAHLAPQIATQPAAQPAGPFVVTDDEGVGKRGTGKRKSAGAHKSRKNPSYAPIILLAIAAIAVAGLALYVLTRPAVPAPPRPSDEIVIIEQASPPPAVTDTRLRIEIDEQDRSGVAITVDRRRRQVATRGDIAFDLSPGSHTVVIRREGYLTIDRDVEIAKGKTSVLKTEWKVDEDAVRRANRFDIPSGALNDLNQAKSAGASNKGGGKAGADKKGNGKKGAGKNGPGKK